MKQLLFFFFAVLFFSSCSKDAAVPATEEPPLPEFQKTYGGTGDEVGYDIIQASDKNYIITGSTTTYGSGSQDVWLMKTNQSGDIIWKKTFGGANVDIGYSVIEKSNGNLLVAGVEKSFMFGMGLNVYLVETDKDGNLIRQKNYGDNTNDGAHQVIALNDNSGYILAGGTGGTNLVFQEYDYLIKVNASGNTLWSRKFQGNNGGDEVMSAAAGNSGDFYIFCNTFSFGTSNKGMLVMKFNSAGDSLWSKVLDGNLREEAEKIKVAKDGGLLLCGYTESFGNSVGDMYAAKLSAGGNIIWEKNYGGTAYDRGKDVIETEDGGLLFAGVSKSYGNGTEDMLLVKTDASGNQQWTKTIATEHHDEALAVMETGDAYVITGSTRTGTSINDLDLMFVKIKKQ